MTSELTYCPFCGHDQRVNPHGFDQNDAYLDENDQLTHSGRCTYCRECRADGYDTHGSLGSISKAVEYAGQGAYPEGDNLRHYHELEDGEEGVCARIFILDAAAMGNSGRHEIAAWLREQADKLESRGEAYAELYEAARKYIRGNSLSSHKEPLS